MFKQTSKELLEFISKSPTSFHAVATIKEMLENDGYIELTRANKWAVQPSGRYFTTMNNSALIAFVIGQDILHDYSFNISASHCDAPCYKVKPITCIKGGKEYTKLNVEMYGGAINAPWLDRPLSVAGRVIVKEGNHFTTKLVNIDKDLLFISNMAPHINRDAAVNGTKYTVQVDMLPVLGSGELEAGAFEKLIADNAGVKVEDIVSHELYVYPRTTGNILGLEDEFIGSPRLDDLQCVFTTLKGFMEGYASKSVNVLYIADNEEVGSSTKQGAGSTFLYDTLQRINTSLNKNDEAFKCALAASMMVSADNAHAIHPAHPEKADPVNNVKMNGGVVIKHSARQSYTTDAMSSAIFMECCNRAGVPFQHYTNHSNIPGGGTLGSISARKVSVYSIDIGLAQLAMHSCYEVAGIKDTHYTIEAMKAFYSQHISVNEDGDLESTPEE